MVVSTPEERAAAVDAMAKYFEETIESASKKWRRTMEYGTREMLFVEAVAGTGSRYQVVVTKLMASAAGELDGTHVVSVLQPVQTAFVVTKGDIHMSYVHEKVYDNRSVHGGDLVAMTATIQWALNGELGLDVLAYRNK